MAAHKPGVLEAAASLRDRLNAAGVRSKMDDSDNSPGWKFAEYEMKGVPVRVEIGPKDMEKEQCVIARRDTGEKITVALAELESAVKALLDHIHDNLYAMALKNREDNTFDIQTPEEAKAIVEGKGGFLRSKWCGSLECELAMKERAGVSSRCMPLVQTGTEGTCPCAAGNAPPTSTGVWLIENGKGRRGTPPPLFFSSPEGLKPTVFLQNFGRIGKRSSPPKKSSYFHKKQRK